MEYVGFVFGIAARIGEGTAVEDKAAAVARRVGGETFFEAEREDGDGKLRISYRGLKIGDAAGSVSTDAVDFRKRDGEWVVLEEIAKIIKGQWDRLDKIVLALEEATVTIGSEGLEYTDKEVGPEVVHPLSAFLAADVSDVEIVA